MAMEQQQQQQQLLLLSVFLLLSLIPGLLIELLSCMWKCKCVPVKQLLRRIAFDRFRSGCAITLWSNFQHFPCPRQKKTTKYTLLAQFSLSRKDQSSPLKFGLVIETHYRLLALMGVGKRSPTGEQPNSRTSQHLNI